MWPLGDYEQDGHAVTMSSMTTYSDHEQHGEMVSVSKGVLKTLIDQKARADN